MFSAKQHIAPGIVERLNRGSPSGIEHGPKCFRFHEALLGVAVQADPPGISAQAVGPVLGVVSSDFGDDGTVALLKASHDLVGPGNKKLRKSVLLVPQSDGLRKIGINQTVVSHGPGHDKDVVGAIGAFKFRRLVKNERINEMGQRIRSAQPVQFRRVALHLFDAEP